MKIAILNSLYERGGAEMVVRQQLQGFLSQGQEVVLIVTETETGLTARLRAETEKNDPGGRVPYRLYALASRFGRLADHSPCYRLSWQIVNLCNWRKYFQIKKILKAEKPDLVITHNLMGLGYLMPSLIKKLGYQHEHYLHDIQLLHPSGLMFYGQERIITSFAARIYQKLTRCRFKSVKKVISPSKWLIDLYLRHDFFKKAETIIRPNFPLVPKVRSKKERAKGGAADFLFIGQLVGHKGAELLIQAWLTTRKPGHLHIIGDGHDQEKINALIAGQDNISLYPYSEAKSEELLERCDCLVVPSLVYENSPSVIYRAKAAGLPVIASDLGGIPELLGAEDYLFQPGNQAELSRIISEF